MTRCVGAADKASNIATQAAAAAAPAVGIMGVNPVEAVPSGSPVVIDCGPPWEGAAAAELISVFVLVNVEMESTLPTCEHVLLNGEADSVGITVCAERLLFKDCTSAEVVVPPQDVVLIDCASGRMDPRRGISQYSKSNVKNTSVK